MKTRIWTGIGIFLAVWIAIATVWAADSDYIREGGENSDARH